MYSVAARWSYMIAVLNSNSTQPSQENALQVRLNRPICWDGSWNVLTAATGVQSAHYLHAVSSFAIWFAASAARDATRPDLTCHTLIVGSGTATNKAGWAAARMNGDSVGLETS